VKDGHLKIIKPLNYDGGTTQWETAILRIRERLLIEAAWL